MGFPGGVSGGVFGARAQGRRGTPGPGTFSALVRTVKISPIAERVVVLTEDNGMKAATAH